MYCKPENIESINYIHLVITQRPYDGLVQQKAYVLGVIQNLDLGGTLLGTTPVLGLTRVDSLQDAETAKVIQG